MSSEPVTLSRTEALTLAATALVANETSQANAQSTALALVNAESDGQAGHGLSRVPSYALQAKTGKVTGRATPRVVRSTPAAIRIDAGFGFAYPAIDVAIAQLTPLARSQGVATAAIFRSHHFGQAGAHVERLAREGLIGIAFSNTPKAMAFHGAAHATLGTNPLAFAAPLPDREPLVIDMALSVVARSKIVAAQHGGQTIPLDWAVDAEGRPTADPAAALQGALLPVGGAKGSALALMVEVLCGALAGAAFGWEASSFLDDKGAAPNMGHVLLALDPQAFAAHDFLPRMRSLANEVEACGARLPGDRRLALRSRAQHSGLTIPAKLHREILAWC